MGWSIAYETTALGLSPVGGMATVCNHTLREMSECPEHSITGYFRHGQPDAIAVTGVTPRPWRWYSRYLESPFDLHHGLCHRLLPLKARARVLSVYDAWSLYPNRYQSADFQRRAERLLRASLNRSDHVITCSETTRARLLANSSLSPDRVSVIYPGPAVLPAAASPLPQVQSDTRPFALFVGRLEYRKNLPHVVEAMRPIEKLRLVVVGEPGFGYETDSLPALARFPADRLLILPKVTAAELRWLFERAVATLLPSWEEGFGLPALEAMAAGCPVITSNGSAMAEIAGEVGLLSRPDTPSDSTQHLEHLIESPQLRREWTEAGRKRAESFTWRQYREQLVALYARLLI